jgi:hypothetical protein
MLTHLQDNGNNLKVEADVDGKINLSDVIKSIRHRINKHRDYIKEDKQTIILYAEFAGIVKEAVERIEEREAKIGELEELIDYSLGGLYKVK